MYRKIRILLKARLKKEYNTSSQNLEEQLIAFRNKMEKEPIAHSVDSANNQHYEVPVLLFKNFMGKYLKYSCALLHLMKYTYFCKSN